MTKLVYIGGYGHSGSTLLEYLLAADGKVLACGEVASAVRQRGRKEKCTCGRGAEDCPVWGPLHAEPGAFDGSTHTDVTMALFDRAGDAAAVMIDSSKTPWLHARAPFQLRSRLGDDFLLLHIVRDPRAVAWSGIKKAGRQERRPLAPLRSAATALGWSVANLACEIFARRYPDQYIRIRYEDMAKDPATVIQGVLRRILPNSEWRPDEIGKGANRHQLYGNRLRAQALSLADIKEDSAWNTAMPPGAQALVAALTAPLRARYGYR